MNLLAHFSKRMLSHLMLAGVMLGVAVAGCSDSVWALPNEVDQVSTCYGTTTFGPGAVAIYPFQFDTNNYLRVDEVTPGAFLVTVALQGDDLVGGYQVVPMVSAPGEERTLEVVERSVAAGGKLTDTRVVLVETLAGGNVRLQFRPKGSPAVAVWEVTPGTGEIQCFEYEDEIAFNGVATQTMRVLTSSVDEALNSLETLHQQVGTATQLSADFALASDKANRCLTALSNARGVIDEERIKSARVTEAARELTQRVAAAAKSSRDRKTKRQLLNALKKMSSALAAQ